MTPQELRAQADAMEAEAAKALKGKVFISMLTGTCKVNSGEYYDAEMNGWREATDAEIQALRTIPEFASRLDKVRGA